MSATKKEEEKEIKKKKEKERKKKEIKKEGKECKEQKTGWNGTLAGSKKRKMVCKRKKEWRKGWKVGIEGR